MIDRLNKYLNNDYGHFQDSFQKVDENLLYCSNQIIKKYPKCNMKTIGSLQIYNIGRKYKI